MQSIARANRVFPGKQSGLIVDYANVFASLEKALAIYGAGTNGKSPVRDKQELVDELRKAVEDALAFCASHRVPLEDIEKSPPNSMARLPSSWKTALTLLFHRISCVRNFLLIIFVIL